MKSKKQRRQIIILGMAKMESYTVERVHLKNLRLLAEVKILPSVINIILFSRNEWEY